jgi:hypothetical protein
MVLLPLLVTEEPPKTAKLAAVVPRGISAACEVPIATKHTHIKQIVINFFIIILQNLFVLNFFN